MISILTPHYILREIKLKPKMFNAISDNPDEYESQYNNIFSSNESSRNDSLNQKNISENNDENRFVKLLNDKYEKKDNYVYKLNNEEFNKKPILDDYMNFKKRKSYTYNHYKNFNNKKNYYKNKYGSDDLILNKNIIRGDYKEQEQEHVFTISSKEKLIDKKKEKYIYNPIFESKNYPDLEIDEDSLSKILIDNYDNDLISKLKSINVEINIPITSYGIVLYTYEKNKYLKYLVCQRRDSISYIQYLQDLIDETNIVKYINLMSREEKDRCLEYYYKKDPHSIWKDLWINHNSKIYKQDYKRCTDIFLKNMEKYIEYFKDDKLGQNENSWCFPKGRLHTNENQIECALREFEEETCIPSKCINVNKNISFEEVYIGSNNLLYKTVYYIAYIPYIPKKIYKHYPNNIRKKFVSSEFYEIEWMEYQNATEKLNESKKQILEKINNYILKRSFKK